MTTGVLDSNQNRIAELNAAVTGLEAQRQVLGDAIVNPALESLRETIRALETHVDQPVTGTETVEERNIVTVLFADIVGSTAMASRLDPEDWHGTLTEVHRKVGGIVENHGGLVVHYLGDGLLAMFGVQKMSEMDAENAVRAGLAIQLALAQRPFFPVLQMRVGIHTGLVFLGQMGTAQKQEFSASGKAMNLAARLQTEAPPGGVVVSHETYQQPPGASSRIPPRSSTQWAIFSARHLPNFILGWSVKHPERTTRRGKIS
jgi:class 3 adenylate cyclase